MLQALIRNLIGTTIMVALSLFLFSQARSAVIYHGGKSYFNYPIYVLAQVSVS